MRRSQQAKMTSGDFSEFFFTNPTSKTQTSRVGRSNSAYSRPATSKFSTIRSVTRGVRNLNITEIVRPNRNLLQLQAPSLVLPQDESLNTLAMIKRVHDKTLTSANIQQRGLLALRLDNERLKMREFQTYDTTTQIDRDNALYFQQANSAGDVFQNTCWTMKCYEYMAERLKNDKMNYEKRLSQIQEEIKRKQNEMRDTHEKYENVKHLGSNTAHVLKQLRTDAELLSNMKQERIHAFEEGIQNQREMKDLKDRQLEEIDDIMEYAMQEKGSGEKTWRRLFLAHKLLKGVLKAKMDRQMRKFCVVQQSYQRIKMQSGVVNAQDIVKKFMLRDQSYGNLLASISEAERRITLLKKDNEQLKVRQQKLQEVSANLDKPARKNIHNLDREYKKVSKATQLNLKSQQVCQQLHSFALGILKKLDVIQGQRPGDNSQRFSKKNLRELYDFMNQRVKSLNTEDTRQQSGEVSIELEVTNPKNFRITHILQPESGDEIKMEEDVEEDAYINLRRNKVSQENSGFFQDLRRKEYERSRARMEKEKALAMLLGTGKKERKEPGL